MYWALTFEDATMRASFCAIRSEHSVQRKFPGTLGPRSEQVLFIIILCIKWN